MKILITGCRGQLGHDLMRRLADTEHEAVGVDIEEMDITDKASVRKTIAETTPDAVIHCAAYTQVDRAEEEPELCERVNALGTENIAQVCREHDIKLMYISTDYVFDGTGQSEWNPDDMRDPVNIYGKTKFLGELVVERFLEKYFIVRISWAFGVNGKNFIKTMLQLSKKRKELIVVDDQVGSPTYTYDLARLLIDMIATDRYGTYHATNEGICSWYDLACEVFHQVGADVEVKPVASSSYPTKAIRPKNSRMSKNKLEETGFERLPHWKDAVCRFLEELKEEER